MNPTTRSPWIIAHRGASRDRPENTLAAFDEALRQRAGGIELDVQLSRDAVPVVYHHKTLARAGGGRKRVSALSFDELGKLDAAHRFAGDSPRQRIPSLEEVLARYGTRIRLFVEIKTREGPGGRARHMLSGRAVAEMVERMGLVRNVLLLSFDPDVLDACASACPRIGRVLNLAPPRELSADLKKRLSGLFALCVDVRTLTPSFAREVRRAGRPFLTYTCNTRATVLKALRAGALGVVSDRPGWLAETVRSLHEA